MIQRWITPIQGKRMVAMIPEGSRAVGFRVTELTWEILFLWGKSDTRELRKFVIVLDGVSVRGTYIATDEEWHLFEVEP